MEEKKKKNKGLVVVIILLVLVILGMGIFILYDKEIIFSKEKEVKEEKKKEVEKEKKKEKENFYQEYNFGSCISQTGAVTCTQTLKTSKGNVEAVLKRNEQVEISAQISLFLNGKEVISGGPFGPIHSTIYVMDDIIVVSQGSSQTIGTLFIFDSTGNLTSQITEIDNSYENPAMYYKNVLKMEDNQLVLKGTRQSDGIYCSWSDNYIIEADYTLEYLGENKVSVKSAGNEVMWGTIKSTVGDYCN